MDVDALVECAYLVGLAGVTSLFELPVGFGDVSLSGMEEASWNKISFSLDLTSFQEQEATYRRVASSLMPSHTSCSPVPTGRFKRP